MQDSAFPAQHFLLYHASDRERKILWIFQQREIMCSERTELLVIKYSICLSHWADFIVFAFTSAILSVTSSYITSLFYYSEWTVGDEWTLIVRASSEPLWLWVTINRGKELLLLNPCTLGLSYSKTIQQEPTYVWTSFYLPALLFLFFIILLHAYLCCLLRTCINVTNYTQQEEGTLRHPYLRVIVFT